MKRFNILLLLGLILFNPIPIAGNTLALNEDNYFRDYSLGIFNKGLSINSDEILNIRIFFKKNKSKVPKYQYYNLEQVISYLKDHEDKRLVIIGMGDSEKTRKNKNETLAYKRAKAVYKILEKNKSVLPDRIIISPSSDNLNLDSLNNYESCVIFIIKPRY